VIVQTDLDVGDGSKSRVDHGHERTQGESGLVAGTEHNGRERLREPGLTDREDGVILEFGGHLADANHPDALDRTPTERPHDAGLHAE
jgi:hypothetical protein